MKQKHFWPTLIALSLGCFTGCKDKQDFKQIYNFPNSSVIEKIPTTQDESIVYLTLVADISQQTYPLTELKSESSPSMMPSTIKVGGLSYLSSYLKVLKSTFKEQSFIVSLGETLSGHKTVAAKSEQIQEILPKLPLDYLHYGFNELNYSKDESPLKGVQLNWVNSNIFDIKSGQPLETWNARPFFTKDFDGVKIGFMAITSYKSLSDEQKDLLRGQYFQDSLTSVLRTKNLLKKAGAEVFILTYKGQMDCHEEVLSLPTKLSTLKEATCLRKDDNELYQLISKLPDGTLDLILTSDARFNAKKINDTPIIGSPDSKSFLTNIRLSFNKKSHQLIKEKSYALPSLKMCHEIFAGLEDCVLNAHSPDLNELRYDFMENTAFGLMPAKFLDQQIVPNKEIQDILNGK